MTVDDFDEALSTDLDTTGARTVGGLVFNELPPAARGRRSRGRRRALAVEQLDAHRITRLLVRLPGERLRAGAGAQSRRTRDDESSSSA